MYKRQSTFVLKRTWGPSRVRQAGLALSQALIIVVVLCAYISINGLLLGRPSRFCEVSTPLLLADFVSLTAWNLYLLSLVIDGHSVLFNELPDGSEVSVDTLPLRIHWKKVAFITLPMLGALLPLPATMLADVMLANDDVQCDQVLAVTFTPRARVCAALSSACTALSSACVTTETRPLDRLGHLGEFEQDSNTDSEQRVCAGST